MAKKEQKKRRASFGVLFWIAFILLIATVFLYNRDQIARVLEETQLVSVLRDSVGLGNEDAGADADAEGDGNGATPAAESDPANDGEPAPRGDGSLSPDQMEEDETAPQIVELRDPGATRPERAPDQPAEPSDSGEAAAEDREESRDGADGNDGAGDPGAGNAVERPRPERVRDANIYYIRVTDDGKIHPHQVERQVSYDNSPMTRTLQVLIDGPTMEELNLGLLNLIPKDTRLLSARVENGTAYLNFNESFRFNSMGVEGYLAQLQQIVFAATEFDTVERVQILIDGQRREYLGGEGVYIGEPLTRESFS